jgi:DNA-binding NarL/FixJ family response regulator
MHCEKRLYDPFGQAGWKTREGRGGHSGVPADPVGRRPKLSPQQERVLSLHAHGLADKEIAERLGLSLRTVRAHMHGAMARLGARTRGEGVLTAVRAGYLEEAEPDS